MKKQSILSVLFNAYSIVFLSVCSVNCYSAVIQLLNDNFYQNPATLNLVNQAQFIAGNAFLNPVYTFDGISYGTEGGAKSNVNNSLPYFLSAYRLSERFVAGFNVTPSGYGHLDWDGFPSLARASTVTNVRYYRYGFQSGYQYSDRLALGLGLNVEDNQLFDLNFVVLGLGNELNGIHGVNMTGDLGLYYKIDSKNYITLAGYTQVNTYGHGTSSAGSLVSNHFSLNITQAPVIYVGLEHFANEKWFVEGKVYWSGWSIQKNINYTNSVNGTYLVPTRWQDVWSFQASTRYAVIEKLGLLGSILYETNPSAILSTNAIAYPLAATGALSVGVDISLGEGFSLQGIYSYGAFLPNSPINNENSVGMINAHFQTGMIQLSYKI